MDIAKEVDGYYTAPVMSPVWIIYHNAQVLWKGKGHLTLGKGEIITDENDKEYKWRYPIIDIQYRAIGDMLRQEIRVIMD